jgi:hypothetical protein
MKMQHLLACLYLLVVASGSYADTSDFIEETLHLQSNPTPFSDQHILEFWGYHDNYQQNNQVNQSNTLKLRYYQPLQMDSWRGTARLDTSYVSAYGPTLPNQSASAYTAGNTLLTVWGKPPEFLSDWNGSIGGRVIFPFGNNGQWAAGPQLGMVFQPVSGSKSVLSDFSPLARYMYGFYNKNSTLTNTANQPALARRLELYPTLGFNLSPSTQLRFWDENGIVYNSAGGGWFIPIDAMVTQRISKQVLFAVGASKQLVQTYQQYNWEYYAKIAVNF